MKKAFILALFLSFAPATVVGCGATLGTIIATVLTVVQDAVIIIDEVEAFVNEINISDAAKYEIVQAIYACRESLSVINSLAKAGKSLDDKDVQAAIENFKDAFNKLMAMVDKYGIRVAGREALSATPTIFRVRAPQMLRPIVQLKNGDF
jgi:hypothetical protein